jgi:RND family efflux transporter MFP subunit
MRFITLFRSMLFLPLILAGCISKPDPAAEVRQPVTVNLSKVESAELSIPIHCVGKLSARSEVKLSFKTGGIISSIFVEEGEYITVGTKMAQLDLSEIQATMNQANLGLAKAGRDLERVENLYRDSVATREQYDNAQTAYNVALNQVRIARFNLRYSTITAPSSGLVLKRIAEENEITGPGHPVFLFAASEDDWVLKVNLTDKEIVKVSLLDSASISFDAYPDRLFSASVSEIGSFSDPYTGTYEVELTLDKRDELLVSGFIGKANILPKDKQKYLLIPISALLEASERHGYIYLLKDTIPIRKRIEIAAVWNEKILVREGLDSTALVITEGAAFIRPDSRIRILYDENE